MKNPKQDLDLLMGMATFAFLLLLSIALVIWGMESLI